MKHIFSNADCIEAFLYGPAVYGRNQSGVMTFSGDYFYCYNTPIAHKVQYNSKEKLLLIKTNTPAVRHARGGFNLDYADLLYHFYPNNWSAAAFGTIESSRFYVYSLEPDHQVNLKAYLAEIKKQRLAFDNSRWSARNVLFKNQLAVNRLRQYCTAFDLPIPLLLGLELRADYPFVQARFWGHVVVPRWLSRAPKLKAKFLYRIKNAEVRRAFISRFPGGIAQILRDLHAHIIDHQPGYDLLLLDLRDTNPAESRLRPYLRMINPSTGEVHVEGVHPDCRTVQDAINYRRFGAHTETDHTVFLPPKTKAWQPTILT